MLGFANYYENDEMYFFQDIIEDDFQTDFQDDIMDYNQNIMHGIPFDLNNLLNHDLKHNNFKNNSLKSLSHIIKENQHYLIKPNVLEKCFS